MVNRWRKRLVENLDGVVLEIGVGTGENLPYYRRATKLYAVEPHPDRAERARQTTTIVPSTVEVAAAEALPYDPATFDHVVSSLVFCSVADQEESLAEIARVLKPGGTLHMVEHIRPETRLLARLFAAITPWWSSIAHNCHLDRPTVEVLKRTGWQVTVHKRRAMFVRLECRRRDDPRAP